LVLVFRVDLWDLMVPAVHWVPHFLDSQQVLTPPGLQDYPLVLLDLKDQVIPEILAVQDHQLYLGIH